MLNAWVTLLRTGVELVFCMMLVIICLSQAFEQNLYRKFYIGCIAGVIASILLYVLNMWVVRIEVLDVAAKGLFVLTLLLFFSQMLAKSALVRWRGSIFLLLGFSLLLDKTSHMIAAYAPIFAMENGFNSEWVLKNAAAIAGVLLLIVMAFGMKKIESKISRPFAARFLMFALTLLLASQMIELLQLLFGLRMLPLTLWVLNLLVPFINHKDMLIFGQLAIICLFLLMLAARVWEALKIDVNGALNPAQKRKKAVKELRVRYWFIALTSVMFVINAAVIGNVVQAAKKSEEKVATPIGDVNGHIVLSKTNLKEKELNVFSYELGNHKHVRFMAIRKAGENFGVALDACPICGEAGYYQKDGQIICKKCGSVVNISTIGFKGGCNPIPIKFEVKANGTLDVMASELGKAKEIF